MTNLQRFSKDYSGRYYFFLTSYLKHETNQTELVFSQRKNLTPDKPPLFLLEIDNTGKRQYLSSLYPVNSDYCFEKFGKVYFMQMNTTFVDVKLANEYRNLILNYNKHTQTKKPNVIL